MSFAGPPGARSSTERKGSTPTRLRYFGPDHGAKFRDHANANFKGMARIRVKPDWVELIDLQTDIPAPNEAQKPGSAERISEYLSLYSDVRSHTLDKVESRAPDSHGHGPLPVSSALKGVAVGLLDEHVRHCVREAADQGDERGADEMITEATRAIERLVRS